jgi:hypothetical protein
MVGVGWVQPIAPRLSAVLSGLAGYSFNRYDKADTSTNTLHLVVPAAVDRISDSSALEVSGRLWFDVHPRLYLMGGASLLRTRPTLTLVNGSQEVWKADQIRLETGVAILIFRHQ